VFLSLFSLFHQLLNVRELIKEKERSLHKRRFTFNMFSSSKRRFASSRDVWSTILIPTSVLALILSEFLRTAVIGDMIPRSFSSFEQITSGAFNSATFTRLVVGVAFLEPWNETIQVDRDLPTVSDCDAQNVPVAPLEDSARDLAGLANQDVSLSAYSRQNEYTQGHARRSSTGR